MRLTLGERAALWSFQQLIRLLLPLFLLRLWWRGRRQPGYRAHWRERLGWYQGIVATARHASDPENSAASVAHEGLPVPGAIWIHAVSVGETRACVPLVAALRARDPHYAILLTHMTPTGRDTGRELFGDQVTQCYLPYDTPGAVARFLAHYRPAIGMLMETELWPTLIQGCAARDIPLWLVNARLSGRSARGYARVSALVRPALATLTGVCAQSVADAERLAALGAGRLEITGNLKFDAPLPAEEASRSQALRRALGAGRPVWLAASTRDGEEALLLDALLRADQRAGASEVGAAQPASPLLVLVPRHPQRFDEVAALLDARGLSYVRRSGWSPTLSESALSESVFSAPVFSAPVFSAPARSADTATLSSDVRVVLGDTMGELGLWFGAVDLAWIGGSLLPLGGQNLLEACARGCPVLLGPHMFNFAAASAEAVALGAARQVADADALLAAVGGLLVDGVSRSLMAAAGLGFVAQHRGATARTMQALGLVDAKS